MRETGITRIMACVAMAATLALSGPAIAENDVPALNQQVIQLHSQGKYNEAIAIAEQALVLAERTLGSEHSETLQSINNLGDLYQAQGRYGEAETLYKRALDGREKVLGPEHPDTLGSVNSLGVLYWAQGRYSEAETLYKRALNGREKALGPEHPTTLSVVSNLGVLNNAQGRYSEAELLHKRALAGYEKALGPEHPDTLRSVNSLGFIYSAQGRYSEAEPLFKRAIQGREKALGPEHPDTQASVNNLAVLYQVQGRYSEAEPLYKRALAGYEKALGPEHPNTLKSVNNMGGFYQARGRYGEAEPLYKRALVGYEKALGPEHPDTLKSVIGLGGLYQAQGRYNEAELLFKRVLAGYEKALGPEHPETLASGNNLAVLYQVQGRYSWAEPFFKRALAGYEKALGPEHPGTLAGVDSLGGLYWEQGRYSEAEPLFKRALTGREKTLGPEHPDTLTSVSGLGGLYLAQGRYSEAEPLFMRVLAGYETALGPEHLDTLASVNNLAALYQEQGRYSQAEPLYKRALAGYERALGPEHPDTLSFVNSLGSLYRAQGRYGEAEPLFKRALAGREKTLGPEHPDTLGSVNSLGGLYQAQGRYREAEPLWKRALAGREKALGPEHPTTLGSVNNLAALHFAQRDWQGAAQLWRRSTTSIAGLVQRGVLDAGLTSRKRSEAEQWDWQFWILVKAAYRLVQESRAPEPAISAEMFRAAQWVLSSEAAQSLAQMSARGAKGDPALAAVVRERQDLVDEWQRREKIQVAALGQETAKRNAKAEVENLARMAAIDKRLPEIDVELKDKFPDYAAMASTAPLTVEDLQAQLGGNEVLLLFLDTPEWQPTPEETFIWVVTKTQMRWVHSDLGRAALTREVQALRCGLDGAAWATSSGAVRCTDLLGITAQPDPSQPLPFDLGRAHSLYKALFGQVEDLIKDKHLLIVPSGPLTQLPFQVLVTAPSADGNYRSAAWLARDHALSVLPAASSLKALRRTGRPSGATKPLIGFGNPLLDGADAKYTRAAQLARERQSCPRTSWQRVAALFRLRGGATPIDMRRGLANVSSIRELAPLPETADELCAVARDIGADVSELRLGAKATEREVKAMNERGELAKYRIVHFATHGAMAGELSQGVEPGLILTPPDTASEEDDGYLSASEIATLKLDADWVILSACNAAAGDAASAEALSGLARAFIYAQARALLVSHWAVDSQATVKLITAAMRETSRDKAVGRAEALRRAMLTLIDQGKAHEAHTAFWAPFIVVGEGARR